MKFADGLPDDAMEVQMTGKWMLLRVVIAIFAILFFAVFGMSSANAQAYHLTFDDEFNSLSISNSDLFGDTGSQKPGTFEAWYRCPDAPRHLVTGEQEQFVDLDYAGLPKPAPTLLGINPFSDRNGIAELIANPAPAADYPFLENQRFAHDVRKL
jgi:hypothetical protein